MKRVLKLLVSLALIAFAASLLDLGAMLRTLKAGSPASFVIAILINLATVLVMGWRWYRLSANEVRLSIRSQLALYFKATFLNTFTPANLGGDAYRLAALSRESHSTGRLLRLLLRERLLGLYGYVLLFALAYAAVALTADVDLDPRTNPYIYGVMVALAAVLVALLARPLGRWAVAIMRRVVSARRLPTLERWAEIGVGLLSPKGAAPLLGLTFAGILLWIASIKVIAYGFGLPVSWAQLAAVATLVELVRLIPITIQGVGLREGVFAYLLGYWGYSHEQSYVVAMTAYLALSISIFLCGPISYLIGLRRQEAEG
ncbi:hypothetical protein PanNE5_17160 [Pandoraea sp. NE5]|uniref:lysylphosphatidylglycerol synthase transmembrane domain-containing protein n=1 Tax=unclassified Pandoraea TaxID=2624094 RepID=UPI0003465C82|nr:MULTISPECIES: lysylphosphatidylglycerol synthase transmembrane domain-containing protein [unclassified Pandoraea]BDD92276.1 hypothetical protein PanNE5_17160 [Pandoraea sp. NE5]